MEADTPKRKSAIARATVRIEEKALAAAPAEAFETDNPAFGIWRDREDMADVAAYLHKLRSPRYNPTTATARARGPERQRGVGRYRCADLATARLAMRRPHAGLLNWVRARSRW